MQAIETRYIGPTDHRGARVKALAEAGTVTVPWDDGLDSVDNHNAAARALVVKLGWADRTWYRGAVPKARGYVYVCSYRFARLTAKRGVRR